MFNSSLNTTSRTKTRTIANSLAMEKIEAVRSLKYDDVVQANLDALGTTATRSGADFTLTYTITLIDDPADGSGSADGNPVDYKQVAVKVAWASPAPADSVTVETFINKNPVAVTGGSNDTIAPVWTMASPLSGRAETTTPGLGIYIQWSPNWATDDQGVVGYIIYSKPTSEAEFLVKATTAPSVGWFLDALYTPGINYSYYVKPFDGAGNIGLASNTVSAVGPIDNIAPSVPTNLSGKTNGPRLISLVWTPSTDNSLFVDHYNVYRTKAGVPYGTTAYSTSSYPTFDDNNLEAGVTYQYNISAVDGAGNESGKSSSVSVTAY
jgi:hypothetical protein